MPIPPEIFDLESDAGSWAEALTLFPNSIRIIDGSRVAPAVARPVLDPLQQPGRDNFIEAVSVPADTSTPAVSEKHGGSLHSNDGAVQQHAAPTTGNR